MERVRRSNAQRAARVSRFPSPILGLAPLLFRRGLLHGAAKRLLARIYGARQPLLETAAGLPYSAPLPRRFALVWRLCEKFHKGLATLPGAGFSDRPLECGFCRWRVPLLTGTAFHPAGPAGKTSWHISGHDRPTSKPFVQRRSRRALPRMPGDPFRVLLQFRF